MLPGNGLMLNLGASMYWPVYQEADRLGCCLAVHGGVHNRMGMDDFELFAPVHALGHPFALLKSLADMLFRGVFDRFPNARFAYLEAGVAWLLMAMERFDGSNASFSQADPRGEHLQLAPGTKVSRYIRDLIDDGRLFVGCEGDELMLRQAVELVGSKPFIYSSDFPHEVTNETCKEEIEELLEYEGLTDSDKRAILRDNAERLYKLQAPVGV
jgi:predicted TIM-barrel fold metal-dependent hydrolase